MFHDCRSKTMLGTPAGYLPPNSASAWQIVMDGQEYFPAAPNRIPPYAVFYGFGKSGN